MRPNSLPNYAISPIYTDESDVDLSDDGRSYVHTSNYRNKQKNFFIASSSKSSSSSCDSDVSNTEVKRGRKRISTIVKKTHYKQRFKSEWEMKPEFKHWLKVFPGDSTRAYCTFCHRDFATMLSDIQRHSKSTYHATKCKPVLDKTQ